MKRQKAALAGAMLACLIAGTAMAGAAPKLYEREDFDGIKLTMLGTGTPAIRFERFASANLVQAGGLDLLFDAGRGASIRMGQIGLPLGEIDAVFLTHFHSDHTSGLADVYASGYIPLPVGGREVALDLYGPKGVDELADGLMMAFGKDVIERGEADIPADATKIIPHAVDAGLIFERDGVKVFAFRVHHHDYSTETFGYRVEYKGHAVVFSGDAASDKAFANHAKGADVIVQEVAAISDKVKDNPFFQLVIRGHTSPEAAGAVFAQAQPKLGIFNHVVQLPGGEIGPSEEEILARAAKSYDGRMMIAEDLTTVCVSDEGTDLAAGPARRCR